MTEKAAPVVDVKSAKFRRVDHALIAMIILPILALIVLKVLFTPAAGEGVQIAGALVFLEIPAPLMPIYLSESQVNSWGVMISILGLCLYLTHGLTANGWWRSVNPWSGTTWAATLRSGLRSSRRSWD